jgi:hypothetical protein
MVFCWAASWVVYSERMLADSLVDSWEMTEIKLAEKTVVD